MTGGLRRGLPAFARYTALLEARSDLARNLQGGIRLVTEPGEVTAIEAAMADRFAARGLPRRWAAVGVMYEDPYLMLLRDAVVFPDGRSGLHHRVIGRYDEPSGVSVLARYRGDIVLIRHFRHATRAWHLEMPRGATEGERDPLRAAQLELSEEIGGTIGSATRLGLLHGASALARHSVVLLYAELTAIGTPELGEGIAEIVLVSPQQFERMVRDGEITDSFTIGAAYHARLRGLL